MADSRPTINVRDLTAVLKVLPPNKSVLIVGPHGVGKSQLAGQVADHFGIRKIDRRLSQMTEGDMIGLPVVSDGVTRFLPVDWFYAGCQEPCEILLDEFNRATPEIMGAAMQIILDRELNGHTLHPETRVYACINGGAHYSVNEMDQALVNRFAIFHLDPDLEDWITWATGPGNIDPVIVDYIRNHPVELRFKDLDKMEPLTAYPTNRGWESVDKCLKHAKMVPSEISGNSPPPTFFQLCAAILGHPSAVGFTKFVKEYARVMNASDILDNWAKNKAKIKKLTHDEKLSLVSKLGDSCKKDTWTDEQAKNVMDFADAVLDGEGFIFLHTNVMGTQNIPNISKMAKTGFMLKVVEHAKVAQAKQQEKNEKKKV